MLLSSASTGKTTVERHWLARRLTACLTDRHLPYTVQDGGILVQGTAYEVLMQVDGGSLRVTRGCLTPMRISCTNFEQDLQTVLAACHGLPYLEEDPDWAKPIVAVADRLFSRLNGLTN
jgi:hypothetical protein